MFTYIKSVRAQPLIDFCKSVVPENSARYETALQAWQKTNRRVVADGERVARSFFGKEILDRNNTMRDVHLRELRALNASRQDEACNRIVEDLEREVAQPTVSQDRQQIEANKAAFDKKYGVEEWPSGKQLSVNPFVYEDKVIGMVLFFEQMVSATEGVFRSRNGKIVFSDIPKGLFTADNANNMGYENIVLAGRVIGTKALKTPMGGELLVPHLEFIGEQFCGAPCNCNDGWPHQWLK